ncbi:hypothetical protein [Polyangium sorediatum]|uniref:Uncharacterized protein n=1 Tax=Polyangium sorediatum TaxID=889274 RepID=A0ABT6NKS0_9BACT|nr:hypothetical protein [Polyangium sorediatum]MDI1428905.1 hypothetical protein [Polyangium sorediatum]
MTGEAHDWFKEITAFRCEWIQQRLDSVDRIIELEYTVVAHISEKWPNQATRAGRLAMQVLVTASTYRSMLELWRENLESLLEPENFRWKTDPPPSGWPYQQLDQ